MSAPTAGPPAPFMSRLLGGRVLVTNDWGHHARLTPSEFEAYGRGSLKAEGDPFEELAAKGFLARYMDMTSLAAAWRKRHGFLWGGAALHIVVLTRRCNMRCSYCHASTGPRGGQMSLETAKTVLAKALETPAPGLTLEFQGGEPLENRPVLDYFLEHAPAEAARRGKDLRLGLVSNLTLMDEDLIDTLARVGATLCTSLDGPPDLHDAQRRFKGGSSHAAVMRWWSEARERGLAIEALLTTTRASLPRAADIVAEYRRIGARGLHLRFLNPLGYAERAWAKIGYSPEEFLAFYRAGLAAAVRAHQEGPPFVELAARVFLSKIIRGVDLNYMDLRSPCGAGIGQLAWDWDGTLYPCDEARLLRAAGDDTFRLGPAADVGPREAARHPTVRALVQASLLESQAACPSCAYKPFCGVCPVLEYATQRDLFGRAASSWRCRIYKGVQDILFEGLEDPATREVFESWAAPAGAPLGTYGRS